LLVTKVLIIFIHSATYLLAAPYRSDEGNIIYIITYDIYIIVLSKVIFNTCTRIDTYHIADNKYILHSIPYYI
jgi:hypothetical protein